MPESKEPRLLTEDEAYAIAAAEVKREVAAAESRISELQGSLTEKANEVDAAVVREQALKDQVAETEKAFADFKASIEHEREIASRREDRVARLREVAKGMPDEFFSEETRIARVVAMEDEDFQSYLSDIADVSKSVPVGVPRESAMETDAKPKNTQKSVLSQFLSHTNAGV